MTKKELSEQVACRTGASIELSAEIIEAALEEIAQALIRGESVYIRGFGTFSRELRAGKKGRSISKNTVVEIPSRYAPKLKFGQSMKGRMPKV